MLLSDEFKSSRGITKRRRRKKERKKGGKGQSQIDPQVLIATGLQILCDRIRHRPSTGAFSLSVRFPVGSVIPYSGFVNAFPVLVDNSSLLVHSKGQGHRCAVFVSLLKTPFALLATLLDLAEIRACLRVL